MRGRSRLLRASGAGVGSMLAGVYVGSQRHNGFRATVEDARLYSNELLRSEEASDYGAKEVLAGVLIFGAVFGAGYVWATNALGLPRTALGGAAFGGGCWVIAEATYRHWSYRRGAWAFNPLPTAAAFVSYGAAVAWLTDGRASRGSTQ